MFFLLFSADEDRYESDGALDTLRTRSMIQSKRETQGIKRNEKEWEGIKRDGND